MVKKELISIFSSNVYTIHNLTLHILLGSSLCIKQAFLTFNVNIHFRFQKALGYTYFTVSWLFQVVFKNSHNVYKMCNIFLCYFSSFVVWKLLLILCWNFFLMKVCIFSLIAFVYRSLGQRQDPDPYNARHTRNYVGKNE